MLTFIGLGVIVFAWIYQFVSISFGNRNIQPAFVGIYAIGVLLLVVDGFMSGLSTIAAFNLVSFVVALLTLLLLVKKGEKSK